jgi:DNA-binding NarL/FixJ family response regulator
MAKSKASTPEPALKKKILIVEDHPMMREGLRGVINREPDLQICGETENAHQALEAVRKLNPHLVLVDITLPGKSGLELVKDLKAAHPAVPILAISMHDESLYAERMLRAGARGYITKQQPPGELVKAIHQVLANRVYVSQQVSETLLQRFSGRSQSARFGTELLTDREFEVLRLIGEGKSSKEIARQLHLSPKTVAVHNANIRQKLKVKNTAEVIRFAVHSEIVQHTRADR